MNFEYRDLNFLFFLNAQMPLATMAPMLMAKTMAMVRLPLLEEFACWGAKNTSTVFHCRQNTAPMRASRVRVSAIRSVTTVPMLREKDMSLVFRSVAHLEISPMRGMSRLRANEVNTAPDRLRSLTDVPKGFRSNCQR